MIDGTVVGRALDVLGSALSSACASLADALASGGSNSNVRRRVTGLAVSLAVLLAASGCTYSYNNPTATPTTVSPDPAKVLSLGANDDVAPTTAGLIQEFARLVAEKSHGTLTVARHPVARAAQADSNRDQQTAKAVQDGALDLGVVPTRAWDLLGITSFRALQSPFLIDSTELMSLIAASDVAANMLKGLDGTGVVPLAMYPEELRWLFGNGRPVLTPEDISGRQVSGAASPTSFGVLRALGAVPGDYTGHDVEARRSGQVVAQESGFSYASMDELRTSTVATGNLPLFGQFTTLVVNKATFASLTEGQRNALRAAAQDARSRVDELAASNATAMPQRFCAAGGKIAWASDAAVAAFHSLGDAYSTELKNDPPTRNFISAIQRLYKPSLPPAPLTPPCGGAP